MVFADSVNVLVQAGDVSGITAIGVKASGGVRSLEDVQKMVEAGATRIGASASVKILEQARAATPSEAAASAAPAGNY